MDIARNKTKNHAHSMLPTGTWLSSSMSTFYGHRGVLNTGSTKIGGMTALGLLSAGKQLIGIYTCTYTGVINIHRFVTMSHLLDKVLDVDIDGHGRFKYILINVQDDVNKASKQIVRGNARSQWHADIFDKVNEEIQKYPGLQTNCVGGGRIEHDPDAKTIKVYGYSQGFGKADHQVSVELLKKKYPDYNITWSDEGY